MQLAPAIAIVPASSFGASHVVSPSKLFSIAETRFGAAMHVLGDEDSAIAPSALTTSIALREAASGVGTLQSVLVPSTPWGPRQIAATAISNAKTAIQTLERYSSIMAPRGEGPFQRPQLGVGTLVLLDTARTALRRAMIALP